MFGSGGVNRNSIVGRRIADLTRSSAQPVDHRGVESQLMKVLSSSTLSAPDFRWLYTVRRAQVGPSATYIATTTSNTVQEYALCVSELTNAGSYVSYGIDKSTIPSGFAPQPIPDGTFVLCVPHRLTDGSLVWLIVATQAVDGSCPGFTSGDIDGGTYTGAS